MHRPSIVFLTPEKEDDPLDSKQHSQLRSRPTSRLSNDSRGARDSKRASSKSSGTVEDSSDLEYLARANEGPPDKTTDESDAWKQTDRRKQHLEKHLSNQHSGINRPKNIEIPDRPFSENALHRHTTHKNVLPVSRSSGGLEVVNRPHYTKPPLASSSRVMTPTSPTRDTRSYEEEVHPQANQNVITSTTSGAVQLSKWMKLMAGERPEGPGSTDQYQADDDDEEYDLAGRQQRPQSALGVFSPTKASKLRARFVRLLDYF